MRKWILVGCVERELHLDGVFDTKSEATDEMTKLFLEATGYVSLDEYDECADGDSFCNDVCAWCQSKWHDNVDWQIFEIEV